METKKMVLIVVLIIILCAVVGAIFVTLTNAVDYERIELTPDGTSIEIPKQEANYVGEINETGCKQWTFKQGTLMSFNSEEAIDARGIYGLGGALGIKAIEDSILNHFEKEKKLTDFQFTVLMEKNLVFKEEACCIVLLLEMTILMITLL